VQIFWWKNVWKVKILVENLLLLRHERCNTRPVGCGAEGDCDCMVSALNAWKRKKITSLSDERLYYLLRKYMLQSQL